MNKTVEHTKLSSIEPGLYVPWWTRCCVSSPSHRVGDSPGFWHQISAFLPWRRGDRERRELGPCLTVMPVPHKAAYCRHPGLPGADLGSETRYWNWYASALFLGASDHQKELCVPIRYLQSDTTVTIRLLFAKDGSIRTGLSLLCASLTLSPLAQYTYHDSSSLWFSVDHQQWLRSQRLWLLLQY